MNSVVPVVEMKPQ